MLSRFFNGEERVGGSGEALSGDLPDPPSHREFTLRIRRRLTSDESLIPQTVRDTVEALSAIDGLGVASHDLEIVLFEALANAVVHGNGARPDREVFLRAYGSPGWGAAIFVRDEGQGFEPKEIPDPRAEVDRLRTHGRGVFLMRQLMDLVTFRRGGREVLLVRIRRPADRNGA